MHLGGGFVNTLLTYYRMNVRRIIAFADIVTILTTTRDLPVLTTVDVMHVTAAITISAVFIACDANK